MRKTGKQTFPFFGLFWFLLIFLQFVPSYAVNVQALRQRGQQEGWTFSVSENPATEIPLEELCGLKEPSDWRQKGRFVWETETKMGLPEAFNWCDQGGCTSIKNQGNCGSCWAFGTVGVLESAILLNEGVEVDLSEQWLVSCNQDGWGCAGGWWAHDYHQCQNGSVDPYGDSGAVMEADFEYLAFDSACTGPYEHPYCIDSWAYIGTDSDIPTVAAMKQAILDHGPISVAVCVDDAFRAYAGGVFNASAPGEINHAVILVGWDDTQGAEGVWLMRNSWGTGWGEEGYMRIAYNCSSIGYAASFIQYSPPDYRVTPESNFICSGDPGGPFTPNTITYTISNTRPDQSANWMVSWNAAWLNITPSSGVLDPSSTVQVIISLHNADQLAEGFYTDEITFEIEGTHIVRNTALTIGQIDYFTEVFDLTHYHDLDNVSLILTPNSAARGYDLCLSDALVLPTDPAGGTSFADLMDNDISEMVTLTGGKQVTLYGQDYGYVYLSDNGYLNFGSPDYGATPSSGHHFQLPRVSAVLADFFPLMGGTYTYKQLGDRFAVTWQDVYDVAGGYSNNNTFQIELFFDGRIRITYLTIAAQEAVSGLSQGQGIPPYFADYMSDLSSYPNCSSHALYVTPNEAFASLGSPGGPFNPSQKVYTLYNAADVPVDWLADWDADWLNVVPNAGQIPAGQSVPIAVTLTTAAQSLTSGVYVDTVIFQNLGSGESAKREVVLQVQGEQIMLADFDAGLNGFTIDNDYGSGNGLWHLTTACLCSGAGHPLSQALYYGIDSQCNYDLSGVAGEGVVVSAPINLNGAVSPVQLSFDYYVETENNAPEFDLSAVEISADDGPFDRLMDNDASNPDFLVDPCSQWQTKTIELTGYIGSIVRLQFRFRTGDWFENNFAGFYVDNVSVTQGTICPYSLAGDVNRDCRVDLADVVVLSANWLVDCYSTPEQDACQ